MQDKKYKRAVIGIDESYTIFGLSIAIDGKLKSVNEIDLTKIDNKTEKRHLIGQQVIRALTRCTSRCEETVIIVERIRTFSQNDAKKINMSIPYIKSTAALISSIVDTGYYYGVKTYSVDTRSWKSKVVGSSKTDPKYKNELKPEKMGAIMHIKKLGFDVHRKDKHGENKIVSGSGKNAGKTVYRDDGCDSGCIALYGFLPENKQTLKLEE